MMRYRVLALLPLLAACSRDPHALVTVEDPNNLAIRSMALSIRLDDGEPQRVMSPGRFPASMAVAAQRIGPAMVRIEALDASAVVIARGAAAIDLEHDSRTPVSVVLARPCVNDAGCNDARSCNGTERCSEARCVAGVPLIIDDGNPCSDDSCTEARGVVHVPTAGGTACVTAVVSGICIDGDCTAASCGDGFATSPEQCDDGKNGDVCDSCTDSCELVASYSCGDNLLCGTEVCDNGTANSDAPCTGCCRTTCEPQRCDDGVTDPGEECDDAGAFGWDGCTACMATERKLTGDISIESDVCEIPAVLIQPNGDVSFSLKCSDCVMSTCATDLTVTRTPLGTTLNRGDGQHASVFAADGSYVYLRTITTSVSDNQIAARSYNSAMQALGAEVTIIPYREASNHSLTGVALAPNKLLVIAYTRDDLLAADTFHEVRVFGAQPTYTPIGSTLSMPAPAIIAAATNTDFFVLHSLSNTPAAHQYTMAGVAQGTLRILAGSGVYKNGVGVDSQGRAVVLSTSSTAGDESVFYQRFLNSSAADGSPAKVSEDEDGGVAAGVIDVASDGSFVVGWSALCELGNVCPFVRTFGANLQPTTPATRVSRQTFLGYLQPQAIRKLSDGTYAFIWFTSDSDDAFALYAAHLDASLALIP